MTWAVAVLGSVQGSTIQEEAGGELEKAFSRCLGSIWEIFTASLINGNEMTHLLVYSVVPLICCKLPVPPIYNGLLIRGGIRVFDEPEKPDFICKSCTTIMTLK